MIQDMMNDRIDIYHLKKRDGGTSYGVPEPDEFYYSDTPDLESVKCSVQRSGRQFTAYQGEPFMEIIETYNLYLLPGVKIGMKDKVVFKGRTFYAQFPIEYRNHIKVELVRDDKWQKMD